MANLALVGHDDKDPVRGNTKEVLVESDVSNSDDNNSEVNSFNFYLSASTPILDKITMHRISDIFVTEFMELKAELVSLQKCLP